MAESTIIVRAQTDQAQDEMRELGAEFTRFGNQTETAADKADASLDAVGSSAKSASTDVKKLESSGKKMGFSLNTAANVASAAFNGMSAGLSTARAASDLFKRSLEGMFNSTEEGKKQFEELRVKFGELIGKVVELAFGTDDLDVIFKQLSDAMAFAVETADWLIGAFRTATDVFQTFHPIGRATAVLIDLVGTAMIGAGDRAEVMSTQMTTAWDNIAESTRGATEATTAFRRATLEEDLAFARDDLASLILENEGLTMATREGREAYRELVGALESGASTYQRTSFATEGFGNQTLVGTTRVESLTEAFSNLPPEAQMVVDAMMNMEDQLETLGNSAGVAATEVDGVAEAASFSSSSSEEDGLGGILGRLRAEAEAGNANRVQRLEAQAAFLEAQRVLKFQAFADERSALDAALAETAAKESDAFLARITRLKAEQAEELALDEELKAKKKAMWDDLASLAQNSGQAAIALGANLLATQKDGEKSRAELQKQAVKDFLRTQGQMLVGEGSRHLFSGAIKVATGNPLGLAEMAAASAAIVGGTALMAGNIAAKAPSGSAVGAGAAPPSENNVQNVNNSSSTEIINNFGIAQDPRFAARAVKDALNDAERYNMN